MPSHPPIPPLLLPYIDQPPLSLALLTSTLGATTSWLILRFIHAFLKKSEHGDINVTGQIPDGERRVVLVSWLRDANFWKEGGRKLGINSQRMHVVNALFQGLALESDGLSRVEARILKAVNDTQEIGKEDAKVLLILDGLDFLLAATSCSVLSIMDTIGELQERCDITVVTSCADLALMQSPTTPLETSHAAFVMSIAHQAGLIMNVKGLDTGFAKDVSGVLSIRRGAGLDAIEDSMEEKEYLYFVEGDGGVRVFERGA